MYSQFCSIEPFIKQYEVLPLVSFPGRLGRGFRDGRWSRLQAGRRADHPAPGTEVYPSAGKMASYPIVPVILQMLIFVKAAQAESTNIRVIHPGDAVTMDLRPDRYARFFG